MDSKELAALKAENGALRRQLDLALAGTRRHQFRISPQQTLSNGLQGLQGGQFQQSLMGSNAQCQECGLGYDALCHR